MIYNGKKMTAFATFTPAAINDGVIDKNTLWSSKGIVDALCPAIKERGSCVSCEPLEGYPLQVVARIECTQEGEGVPSPENVRPITGSSGVVLTHCGKNLFDKDSFALTAGRYVASAGSLTTYSATSNYACTEGFVPVAHLRGKTISLNHPPVEVGGSNPKMVFYTAADGDTAIAEGVTNGYKTTVPKSAKFMRFSVPKEYADGTQIQIEIGSAVTDYEPYNGSEISVAFGSTIYKGEFDVATGLLRVTHKGVAMGGLNWNYNGENGYMYAELPAAASSELTKEDAFSNAFPHCFGDFDIIKTGSGTCEGFAIDGTEIVSDRFYTAEEFEQFIAEVDALVVYKLETPEIVQLNAQQVTALQGVNNLYVSAGIIDVDGRADLLAYINNLTNTAEV